MANSKDKFLKRRARVRRSVKKNSSGRPRLSIHRSSAHIYAQVIDDAKGATLAAASTMDKELKGSLKSGANKDAAAAVGKLVVAHDHVAAHPGLAVPTEALEDVVRANGAVQDLAGRVELPPLPGEDGHARAVHGLDDVVGPHREAVVRRIPDRRHPLGPAETEAEAIEALNEFGPGQGPVRGLFDRRGRRRD